MLPGQGNKDLLGLLSSALPGVRVSARPEDGTDGQTIEHMYKPRESVFGAVARDMVAAGWSVFPQEQDGNRRPGTVNGEMIRWSEKYELAKRLPDVASRLCGGIHFSPDRVVSATYGAVASGAKTGGRAALNFGSGQYRALQQAVERRRPVSPASLTPPASTLSRTPAAGAS